MQLEKAECSVRVSMRRRRQTALTAESHLVWMMNWAMWSTFTRMLRWRPLLTRISGLPPGVALTRGQKAGPDLMLGPILLMPVTRMSLRQFSAVS